MTDSEKPRGDEATIAALIEFGLPEERAAWAVRTGRVPLALVEEVTSSGRVYSAAEVAEKSGVPLPILNEWQLALGIPPLERYRESDLEHARLLGELLRILPDAPLDELIDAVRSDAQALTRIAFASLQLVRERYVRPVREEGGDDVDVALVLAEAATRLLPIAAPLMGAGYQRILEHLLTTELVAAAARSDADALDLAVGFADVVGYTSLSNRITPEDLHDVIEAFETRCYAVAGRTDDIQLVKFLGDAVMFVALDPVHLADALLALTEPAEADSPLAGSPIRCGMAAGNVLARHGDYFGPPVNLAARLTDRARAGTVLADEQLSDQLESHFALRRLPPLYLRGMGRQRPLRLKPLR